MLLVENANLIVPQQPPRLGWLLTEGQRIGAIGFDEPPPAPQAKRIDAQGQYLLPGFIDIHVHGGAGHEAMDATPRALQALATFYAQHGVTGFLATTWTDSRERIDAAVATIAACQGPQPQGATLLGAHLEGPYLNAEKCGAQSTRHIRRANLREAATWLDSGCVRLVALAPEFAENQALIAACVQRGVAVSAAHTNATYADMCRAVEQGLRLTTHTFNAMTGLHHREPGVVGAALSIPELCCELIADTIHVHPAVVNILYRAKGAQGIILITDAIRGAGMPDGDYRVDERTITVRQGMATLADGTLAGSIITMNRAVFYLMQATGEPLEAIWQTTSHNAARIIGVSQRKGSLEVGKDADLVLVNDKVDVFLTVAEGRIVYQQEIN